MIRGFVLLDRPVFRRRPVRGVSLHQVHEQKRPLIEVRTFERFGDPARAVVERPATRGEFQAAPQRGPRLTVPAGRLAEPPEVGPGALVVAQ